MRARTLTPAVTALALGTTLAVAVLPSARFAYRSPGLHVAIETAAALIAALAAFLVLGRLRLGGGTANALLASGLGILAVGNLVFLGAPGVLPGWGLDGAAVWASLAASILGAAALAAAALAPGRLRRARLGGGRLLVATLVPSLLAAAAVGLVLRGLSPGVADSLSPGSSAHPLLVGHPALLAAQGVGAVLFAAAAFGFARRADRERDALLRAFAAGAALGAVARVNYLLFPSIYSDWVYTGDALRLGMYVLLLAGAAREIERYWREAARAAVLEERRRLARDLHDGLAQELAFVAAETDGPAALAAERALDESRRAIAALTRPLDEPLAVSLAQAAEEVALRVGVRVSTRVPTEPATTRETREALIRIVREAVTNAARHGEARHVRVELRCGEGIRVEIADDGRGFDPAAPADGFGLTSMRERAEALGGELRLASAPGRGTRVEVALP